MRSGSNYLIKRVWRQGHYYLYLWVNGELKTYRKWTTNKEKLEETYKELEEIAKRKKKQYIYVLYSTVSKGNTYFTLNTCCSFYAEDVHFTEFSKIESEFENSKLYDEVDKIHEVLEDYYSSAGFEVERKTGIVDCESYAFEGESIDLYNCEDVKDCIWSYSYSIVQEKIKDFLLANWRVKDVEEMWGRKEVKRGWEKVLKDFGYRLL